MNKNKSKLYLAHLKYNIMINFFKVASIFIMSLMVFSCNKADDPFVPYVVPYVEQYPKDLLAIDKYLDEYYMEVSADKDVTFKKIPTPNPSNFQSIRVQYASMLHEKIVAKDDINYKVYYISLREGTQKKPTSVDSIFVSYKGEYIYTKKEAVVPATNPVTYNSFIASSEFDQAQNPIWLKLYQFGGSDVIRGWKEIFPYFKSGTNTTNPNGSLNFADFGAGVMFLPSALAYYNGAVGSIPTYSPLIFTFKLHEVNYVDHDYDRIDSKDEGFDALGQSTKLDTDGDGRLNYLLDQDDDGDGLITKTEIKRPARDTNGDIMLDSSQKPIYVGHYPYNGAAVDDPLTTTIDETQGIPRKFTGPLRNPSLPESATNKRRPLPSDYTDPLRVRRHLDSSSKFPYEN